MSVQRVWKPVGSVNSNAEIEHLRLELASFNERIEELEKQHPDGLKIEASVGASSLRGRPRSYRRACWARLFGADARDLTMPASRREMSRSDVLIIFRQS